ncbi:MAG: hypothetical protein ABI651_19925 [Verrucomicrobiota bacterium]
MKTNEPGDPDELLHKVLKEWRTDATLPPHFQEGVWRRIERVQVLRAPSVWTILTGWIGSVLPRPALATAYVAVLLAVGATAGWTQARQETARVRDELGQRYVRVLDPYQAPRQLMP